MTRRHLALLCAALVALPAACKRGGRERQASPPEPAALPPPPPGTGALAPLDVPSAVGSPIAAAEQAVKADPKNVQAWIQLGNLYFDAHQPQKAIDAYARALALRPNDPDVLTDQGVMYRDLRQFDRAIENFEKASKLDPNHLQSRFNLGVVYAYDVNQPKKAVEAWQQIIAIAPQSQQAQGARQGLDDLKARGMGGGTGGAGAPGGGMPPR